MNLSKANPIDTGVGKICNQNFQMRPRMCQEINVVSPYQMIYQAYDRKVHTNTFLQPIIQKLVHDHPDGQVPFPCALNSTLADRSIENKWGVGANCLEIWLTLETCGFLEQRRTEIRMKTPLKQGLQNNRRALNVPQDTCYLFIFVMKWSRNQHMCLDMPEMLNIRM